jgi:hypothetical protein
MLLKMAVLATSNRHEIPPSWYSPEPTSRAKNILLQTVPEWNGCTLNCVFDIYWRASVLTNERIFTGSHRNTAFTRWFRIAREVASP